MKICPACSIKCLNSLTVCECGYSFEDDAPQNIQPSSSDLANPYIYYVKPEQHSFKLGPFTIGEIKSKIMSGTLGIDFYVQREGGYGWKTIGDLIAMQKPTPSVNKTESSLFAAIDRVSTPEQPKNEQRWKTHAYSLVGFLLFLVVTLIIGFGSWVGAICGYIVGLIPLYAASDKKHWLNGAAMVSCIILGAYTGLIGALPAAGAFYFLIKRQNNGPRAKQPPIPSTSYTNRTVADERLISFFRVLFVLVGALAILFLIGLCFSSFDSQEHNATDNNDSPERKSQSSKASTLVPTKVSQRPPTPEEAEWYRSQGIDPSKVILTVPEPSQQTPVVSTPANLKGAFVCMDNFMGMTNANFLADVISMKTGSLKFLYSGQTYTYSGNYTVVLKNPRQHSNPYFGLSSPPIAKLVIFEDFGGEQAPLPNATIWEKSNGFIDVTALDKEWIYSGVYMIQQ